MKKNIFKTLFLLLAGIILGIVLIVSLLIFAAAKFSHEPIVVKNNSWLVLDFSGLISEKPVSNMPAIFSSSIKKIQLIDYLNAIEHAATDDKIDGIVINGDLTFYSRVHNEELLKSIDKFKGSGKEVIAWLSTGTNSNYFLCLAADKIFMPETDSANLTLTGYTTTIPYLKDGFDKLGIEFDVIHIGNYKGSGENYVRSDISKEQKDANYSLLESLYINKISQISKRRNIDLNTLDKIIRDGKTILMTPKEAKDIGLIDGTKNYKGLLDSLKKSNKFNNISISDYSEAINILDKKNKSNKIAIIYIEGVITNYFTNESDYYGDSSGAKSLEKIIASIKEDKEIKSVIVRVNSPGGSALASELIYQSINDLKRSKSVYVSFGTIAASGGYYISLNADRIFTSPSTITGSIGVVSIMMNINEESFIKKYGINFETIKKNKYDDFLSPTRKPYQEELMILEKSMRQTYNEFTDHVIEDRKIDKNKISNIAEGRVWSGQQAIDNKLADDIGGLMDTIEYVKKIQNLEDIQIISYPKPVNFIDKLLGMNMSQLALNKIEIENKYIKQIIDLYKSSKENGYKALTLMPFYEIP